MIDVMRLRPDQIETYVHLQSTHDRQIATAMRVQALREYYDGDHPVMLTERQKEFLGSLVAGDAFPFAHNLTKTIIDTLAERLSVMGFEVKDDADDAIGETLWQWWADCRMDSGESNIHTAALRDGMTYVMVGFDNEAQRPRLTWHQLDDGREGIVARHDPNDPTRLQMATRYWWQTELTAQGTKEIERKTVYLPGEIRKYKRSNIAAGWEPVQDVGDPWWPLPWVDSDGAPLGVAVVEFANPGGSEIAQVIGLQNAINKSWLDLIAAADASGFPILAIEYKDSLPVSESDDDIHGADEINFAPGRALEVGGATVKRLEAANLTPMMDTVWALVAAMAGVTRTPQYYLRPQGGGDVPSGESLKQLESGIVSRATKRQNTFGQSWSDVMKLAIKVNDAFGSRLALPDTLGITTKWQDAETRNELTMAQVAEIQKRLNVPDEQIWNLLGYTPEEIDGFRAVLRSNQAAQVAAIATQLRSVNNGGTSDTLRQQWQGANGGFAQRGGAPAANGAVVAGGE